MFKIRTYLPPILSSRGNNFEGIFSITYFDIRVTLNIKIHRIPPFVDNFFAEIQTVFFSLFKGLCLRIFIVKKVYFKNYFMYGLAL